MDFDQSEYDLRCEWGEQGAHALAASTDVVIVVDVLSFSTAVDIALANGAVILPYEWKADAAQYAQANGAILAGRRGTPGAYTLSPASLRTIPRCTALVLPSPNGATVSRACGGACTLTGCLRNASAVADRAAGFGRRISVIPAGERWADGSLRPCFEDLAGAGAILASLSGTLSPEARAAVAAFQAVKDDLGRLLQSCGSGKELLRRGFEDDLHLAAAWNVSRIVPRLLDGRYAAT